MVRKQKESIDGAKLKALREEKGLSQIALEYLTEEIGAKVDERTIRRLENGISPGRSSTIRILAKALDAKFEELCKDTDSKDSALSRHICDYEDFIKDRTRDFIGREFVFEAIDEFIEKNDSGYFFVRGDPGIGKSSIAAQLVKEKECIHHFNIRAEGINKASTFLKNICSQLVIDYQLKYTSLPSDIADDGRFLNKLLKEVSDTLEKEEKVVIIIDALDEVEESCVQPRVNTLYLPSTLPNGVFVVATTRRQPLNLRIECNQSQFDVVHDSCENLDDVELYLKQKGRGTRIRSYITKYKLTNMVFVEQMKKKSQGNFMYLRHILPEIESGAYKDIAFEDIPVGLENYYEDHWRRMGMLTKPLPKKKIKIVYILSEVLQPVSRQLLADFSQEDELIVQNVLDEWIQFLHQKKVDSTKRFTLYHNSFRDFLNRKDIVQAAGVCINSINKMIAGNLWMDLCNRKKQR